MSDTCRTCRLVANCQVSRLLTVTGNRKNFDGFRHERAGGGSRNGGASISLPLARREVAPERRERGDRRDGRNDHQEAADRRGGAGAGTGGGPAVHEVGDPWAAGDHDDEDALDPAAHLVGGGGLQDG